MAVSRLRRYEERRLRRRFVLSILGSLAILAFLALFGLKILVSFSLLVEKLKGSGPKPSPSQTLILAPTLNPLSEATNSATITVSGSGQPGLTLILYVNDEVFKKLPVPSDGNFTIAGVSVHDGTNTISAKLTDDKGTTSDLSNVISILIKLTAPSLEVTSPTEGATVNGDKSTVTVAGTVKDDSTTVTVNGRRVVVASNGTFSYDFPLNNGGNTLTITASDPAGNQTTVVRHVNYQK